MSGNNNSITPLATNAIFTAIANEGTATIIMVSTLLL
jgi:hypothetical protein